MVAQSLNLTTHDAVTGINSFKNYGALTVTAGFTITKIVVRGMIGFEPALATGGVQFIDFLQHGIQHGTIGYTPTTPESVTAPGTEWLAFECIRPSTSEVASTHGSPGSDVSSRFIVDLVWRGQFYTPSGTDVYYSVGRTYNASVNWYFQGSTVVTYG